MSSRWRHGRARLILAAAMAMLPLLAAPALGARSWGDPIVVNDPDDEARFGGLALTSEGELLVSWTEKFPTYERLGLAEIQGGETRGVQRLGMAYRAAQLATDGSGRAYAVWVDDSGGYAAAQPLLLSERPQGGEFGPPEELVADTAGGTPVVAADARGDLAVFYLGIHGLALRLRRAGQGWSDPVRISDSGIPNAVGLEPDGTARLVWTVSDHFALGSGGLMTTWRRPGGGPEEVQALADLTEQPHLALDEAGNAIVSWVARTSYSGSPIGPVYVAAAPAGGEFHDPRRLAGSTDRTEAGALVGAGRGRAIVAWQQKEAIDADSYAMGDIRVVDVSLPGGDVGDVQSASGEMADGPPALAVDRDGNAAVLYNDWPTNEFRVVRRSAAGVLDEPRNLMCSEPAGSLRDAVLAPDGDLSVLWTQNDWRLSHRGLRVLQDHASDRSSPDPCPPPPEWPTFEPRRPDPGDVVTFDAAAARDPRADTTFRWDFDNDGEYEVDSGPDAVVRHVFTDAGEHWVTAAVRSAYPGRGAATATRSVLVRVGRPPQPTPTADPESGEPARQERHRESSAAAPAEAGSTPARRTATSQVAITVAVTAAPRVRLRTLLRHGVPVRLSSPGLVRARAGLAIRSRGHVVRGPARVLTLRPRATRLWLRPGARVRRALRVDRRAALMVRIVPLGGTAPRVERRIGVRR